ncbi:MAG TPA: hypothetical protein VMZ30_08430 [Pyrinomonadaceae bacterium]|nr:hypothetical protein [Pyrinomonadaceae bacterium]
MNQRTFLRYLIVLCCIAATMLAQATFEVHGQGDRWAGRTVTGTVYYLGRFRGAQSRQFSLRINRLTSAAEVQQLNQTLQSGGQDELLRVLSRMEAGRITVGTGVGITANAIIATEQDGGTKLIVLYERYLQFAELRSGARSENYRFGYAELFLGRGRNEGTLIPAAKVRLRDANTWEVEDFGTYPARLMGLQVRGGRGPR